MSYALLWIEVLVVSLLWVAMLSAIAPPKWKGDRRLASLLIILAAIIGVILLLLLESVPWLDNWLYQTAGRQGRWLGYGLLVAGAAVAVLLAFRVREIGMSQGVLLLAGGVPLLVIGAATAVAAYLDFYLRFEGRWFAYMLSLLLAYIIGATAFLIVATREKEPGIRRGALWPRNRLAIAWLAALVLSSMTLWNMDLEVRARAAVMRLEAGALLMSASPPAVSDARNAAIPYEKAFARLQSETEPGLEIRNREWKPAPDDPKLIALLSRQAQTIALLRQGAQIADCRFEHDYAEPDYAVLILPVAPAIRARELLKLHARYEAAHGRIDSAISDVFTIFRLADHLGQEPILLCALHAMGMDQVAVELLQEILPAVTSTEQLTAIGLPDPASCRRVFSRGFRGEQASGMGFFSQVARGEFPSRIAWEVDSLTKLLLTEPMGTLYRVFILTDDVQEYADRMSDYQQYASQPYFKIRQAIEKANHYLYDQKGGLISSVLTRWGSYLFATPSRAEAALADAQIAIAMTRYRLDHGSLPADPHELVPNYLDELPIDPFNGQPLHVVAKDGGYLIYSVGPNGKDDGGLPRDEKKKMDDIPFHLRPRQ